MVILLSFSHSVSHKHLWGETASSISISLCWPTREGPVSIQTSSHAHKIKRSTTSRFNTVPSELLRRPWWTEGCWCNAACVDVYLTHTHRNLNGFFSVLVPSYSAHRTTLPGEMLIQRKVSPNVSFIFQRWHTAAASHMNKVYLETLLKLNCKQIWMFYGWS